MAQHRVPTDINEIAEMAIGDGILSRSEVEEILRTTREEISDYEARTEDPK